MLKILDIRSFFVTLQEKHKLFAMGTPSSEYDRTYAKHLSEAASGVEYLMVPTSDFHTIMR